MEIAPTVLLNYDDVLASGLLAPGSIAEYAGLYAGDARRARGVSRGARRRCCGRRTRSRIFATGGPRCGAAVANAERFLVLAALVSVLLGGVAVAMAARRFVARRLDAVALMKCLGARHREVLRLNVLQLLILVVAAGVLGCAIGFVAQFGLDGVARRLHRGAAAAARACRAPCSGPLTALGRGRRLRVAAAAAARRRAAGARAAQRRRAAAAALHDDLRRRGRRRHGAAVRAVRRLRAHRLPARRRRRHVLRAVLRRPAARARAAARCAAASASRGVTASRTSPAAAARAACRSSRSASASWCCCC